MKGCSDLKDWVDPIVNHFWFCCQTAEGSEERIKVTLHHGESSSSVGSLNTYMWTAQYKFFLIVILTR